MNSAENADTPQHVIKYFHLIVVLFGLLFFAGSSNEVLKQIVLQPDSYASNNVQADCRVDELQEEGLSLRECELMVAQIQIALESSPTWFRSVQLFLGIFGSIVAMCSIVASTSSRFEQRHRMIFIALLTLLSIDSLSFIAALQTGPLLRAQYLWPILLWFFVHLSLVLFVKNLNRN